MSILTTEGRPASIGMQSRLAAGVGFGAVKLDGRTVDTLQVPQSFACKNVTINSTINAFPSDGIR